MTARSLVLMTLTACGVAHAVQAQTPAPRAAVPPAAAQRGATPRPGSAAPAPPAAPAAPADPAAAAAPQAPAALPPGLPPRPLRQNESTNIRIEVTVTDQRPNAAPL